MTMRHRLRVYCKETPAAAVVVDAALCVTLLASPFLASLLLRWTATTDLFLAPLHRRLWANPAYVTAGLVYRAFLIFAIAANAAWLLRALRNFILITAARTSSGNRPTDDADENLPLPPWPYSRESFAVILGELQDRDGARVPNRNDSACASAIATDRSGAATIYLPVRTPWTPGPFLAPFWSPLLLVIEL